MKPLICCTLVLFIGSAVLLAQPSTIVVSVSDTIKVPATHLSLLLTFQDTTRMERKTDYSASRAEVIRLLGQYKVPWKKTTEPMPPFSLPSRSQGTIKTEPGLTADFSSAAQLDRLLPQLRAIPYVQATEGGVSVDKSTVDETRLYEKLLRKARAEAEMIAGLAGKKVGAVYQIGSPFDLLNPGNSMDAMMSGGSPYGELMRTMMNNLSANNPDRQVTINQNLTISYLLN